MNEKELWEEIRTAKIAALISMGISFINLAVIMFFTYSVLKGISIPM